jgi:ubiquinone/menaquinone biosynthesis C-methylase UbiE
MHRLNHARSHHRPHAFEGRHSRRYDLMARWLLRRVYRRMAADLAAVVPQGAALLDVGTGPGVLLVELARRRPDLRLTGVDLSADMVAAAAANLRPFGERASVQVGDVTALPFADRSFDVVVSSASLHHWEDPRAAVPELARVLRPAGMVHIYDFRAAPFDELADTASTLSVLDGQPPRATRFGTGIPFVRLVHYVMTARSG